MTITERDEFGRIKKKTLSSEDAKKLAAKSAEVRSGGGTAVENLLREQGYNDTDNIAPEYIKIMALQAKGSPSAMAHWRRVHTAGDAGVITPNAIELHGSYQLPEPGDRCPWCGKYNFHPTSQEIDSLVEYLVAHRAIE